MSIRKAIQELATKSQEELYSVLAEVLSVDKEKRTIHARPINGDAEVYDARLQSSLSRNIGMVQFPRQGTYVILSFISKTVSVVICTEDIEESILKIGDQEIRLNSEGVAIKNTTADLSMVMNDLADTFKSTLKLLETFRVICASPGSPSASVFPSTIAQLKAEALKVDKFKQQINTIITEY